VVHLVAIPDFLEYRSTSDLKISPDGKRIGFSLTQPDYPSDSYKSSIWIHEFASGKLLDLKTDGMFSGFIWYDSDTILTVEPGKEQAILHLLHINSLAKSEFGRIPLMVKDLALVDRNRIALLACPYPSASETVDTNYELIGGAIGRGDRNEAKQGG